jgi:hypothetical protein
MSQLLWQSRIVSPNNGLKNVICDDSIFLGGGFSPFYGPGITALWEGAALEVMSFSLNFFVSCHSLSKMSFYL